MKEKLQNLLADGKTGKVIDQLRTLIPSLDNELQEEILMQSSRFETLSKEKRNGMLSYDQEAIQIAKIRTVLLSIINRLPENDFSPVISKFNVMKWGSIIAAAMFILIIAIIEFNGYSISDIFTKEKESVTQENDLSRQDNKKAIPPTINRNNFNIQTESIKQKTSGDKSPAIIGKDVNINYGDNWNLDNQREEQDTCKKK